MKQKISRVLPLLLAAGLQMMPLMRQVLPAVAQGGSSPAWAIILKLGLGTVALMGSYHAVSGATALSPASGSTLNATVGVPFTNNITESGAPGTPHTWRVIGQPCPSSGGSTTFAPGVVLPNPSSFTAKVALSGIPTTAGTFTNSVQVWESTGCGGGSYSAFYTLIVSPPANSAPAFTLTPTNRIVTAGSNTTFFANTSGSPAPTYSWLSNGVPIAGATSTNLTLTGCQLSYAANYTLIASNASGVISNTSALTVVSPPVNQTNMAGTTATLAAGAASPQALTYLWRYSNTLTVPGATNASLVFSNVALTNADTYTLIISNATGAVSFSSTLTVLSPPVFPTGLANVTTNPGATITYIRSATGTAPITYQWFLNGTLKGTAVGVSLTNLQPSDSGTVMEIATNPYGSATNLATITITGGTTTPVITNQPASLIIPQGNTAVFTVVAGGGGLNYQWYRNTSNPVGANAATLSLPAAQPSSSGTYTVVITNASGSVTSAPAQLLVVPPPASSNAPALALPTASPGQFALTFPIEPGFRYLLQGSTDLGSGWVTLADLPPGYSNTQFSFTDYTTNLLNFYRTIVTNQ